MLDVVCFGEILWDIFEARGARTRAHRARLPARARRSAGQRRDGARAARGARGRGRAASDATDSGAALVAAPRGRRRRRPLRPEASRTAPGSRSSCATRAASRSSSSTATTRPTSPLRAAHVVPAMGRARWVLVGTSTLMTRDLARATAPLPRRGATRAGASHVRRPQRARAPLARPRRHASAPSRASCGAPPLVKASEADLRGVAGRRRASLARSATRRTRRGS